MRRSKRLGLLIFAALLLATGAYTAYWFAVAGRVENGLIAWAQSARAEKIDVSWQQMRVSGYPAAFRVDLVSAGLRDGGVTPSPKFSIPLLSAVARPWDISEWRLSAPDRFVSGLATGAVSPLAKLTAKAADGFVAIEPEGGWKLWLTVRDATVEAGARVGIKSADATASVPAKPPRGHSDPIVAFAVAARQIILPIGIAPLGDAIDELDLTATVKGLVPSGKLADAVAAWRDAGGAIELDNLRLKWGALSATATGTLALDRELQPSGRLSGAIRGYDQILMALVQNGQMRPADAGLARIALTMLAKTGPDGEPEIRTVLSMEDGKMFLGPAKLGKAPRLTWE
jgi:hypothetical protein